MRTPRTMLVLLMSVFALVISACGSEPPAGDLEEGTADAPEVDDADDEDDADVAEDEADDADEAEDADDADDAEADDDGGEAPAGDGGELIVGLSTDVDAIDPVQGTTFVGRNVLSNICEKLYDIDEEMNIVGELAADLPEIQDDDGLVVQIPLRDEGILFNDGTEFNAEAVVASIDRFQNEPGSSQSSELSVVENAEAVDDFTVELTLSEPFAPLASIFADRAGMVMSPDMMDELGEDFADDPICVGPFMLESRTGDDRINLEKSDDYYAADEISLDSMVYLTIVDDNVRMQQLLAGDIHVGESMATTDAEALEAEDDVSLIATPSIGYQGLTINVGNVDGVDNEFGESDGPMANPLVREALELSLDREAINEAVFAGQYIPNCSPFPPDSQWGVSDLECPERDVERAQELLEESGEDLPVEFEYMTSTGTEQQRLAELVQQMAGEAGFEVSVRPQEFASALEDAADGNFEVFQIGWSGRIDPNNNTHTFHHSTGSNNYAGGNDDEIDEILDAARTTDDEAERADYYEEIEEAVRDRRSIIYLYHQNVFQAHRNEVQGMEVYPEAIMRVSRASLDG